MTINDLYKGLKARQFVPVYLLQGDEPFFIDRAVRFFETEILPEAERSFNLTIFYGKDSKAQDIIDTCMRYPMFSEHQVVIIKEANQLRDLDKLESYFEHIVPTTILVIAYKNGSYDKRRKVYKLISQKGVVFDSNKIYDRELPAFVDRLLKEKKLTIDDKASRMLVDSIGNNLAAIVNEIDKISLHLQAGEKVTADHIEKFVGISKEFNVFELQNALLEKDHKKAFRILHFMQNNPKANPMVLTMSNIHAAYTKLYKYMHAGQVSSNELWSKFQIHSSSLASFNKAKKLYSRDEVEDVFSIILEYDLRSKGLFNSGTDDFGLLTELVYRVCHPRTTAGIGK